MSNMSNLNIALMVESFLTPYPVFCQSNVKYAVSMHYFNDF